MYGSIRSLIVDENMLVAAVLSQQFRNIIIAELATKINQRFLSATVIHTIMLYLYRESDFVIYQMTSGLSWGMTATQSLVCPASLQIVAGKPDNL